MLHDLGSPGCWVAGLPGCRVTESHTKAKLGCTFGESPGSRVAGSPGCQVKSYSASAKVA